MENIDIAKKEKGERARLVHKDFFDKCTFAIDNGFYLEALCMEYAAIESRMSTILLQFGLICALYKNTEDAHNVGIGRKQVCLKHLLETEKDIFEKSRLTPKLLTDFKKWCNRRNTRIHRLYDDTEKYDEVRTKTKELANEGYKYADAFYKEANRLKSLKKYHPELFEGKVFCCYDPQPTCVSLAEKIKNGCVK